MAKTKKAAKKAPEMRVEYVRLDELIRWPRNPKLHEIPAIEASFSRFGIVAPPILDERSGRLVVGHGRLEALSAMRRAGEDPPERTQVAEDGQWLVPVLRGVAFDSEEEAEAYVLADNKTQELAGYDENVLRDIFTTMNAQAREKIAAVGWDPAEIERIVSATPAVPEPATKAFVGFEASSKSAECKCPKCGHVWTEK